MRFQSWAITALLFGLTMSSGYSQTPSKVVQAPDLRAMETGTTWMDLTSEWELILALGLEPDEIDPPISAMRINDDQDPTDGGGGGGGGGGSGGGPVGVSGVLPPSSAILSQNRFGVFRQVGTIDLCFLLDETWLLIENQVRTGIHERLANAYRDQTGPNLHGFYNINISIAPFTTATKRVYVWPDKHKMRLTWTLPNNAISCRARLNNWPDRDVDIVTSIHLTVDIQKSATWADPVEVVASSISFSNTQASNDGILYEETFNNQTEAEFNSARVDVPAAFTDFMFSDLSQALATNVTPSTVDLQFEYIVPESRLVLRLFNPVKTLPSYELQPATSATQAVRK